MWHGLALVFGLLLSGDPPEKVSIRADDFGRWFESAVEGDLEIPGSVARRARGFRYVFVGGCPATSPRTWRSFGPSASPDVRSA
jgi:hypothetical protein